MSSGKNITSDKVVRFLNSFYSPLDEGLSALRDRCENEGIPLILKETESFLRAYLGILRPTRILEIGTAYGYSACFFAKLIPSSTVITIERDPDKAAIAAGVIRDMELSDRISIIINDANEALNSLIENENEPFDLVFIDAGKSHYREYFDKCERLVSSEAVCICDNILMNASIADSAYDIYKRHRTSIKRMHEFLDYLKERDDLEFQLLSCGDGIAIIRKQCKTPE